MKRSIVIIGGGCSGLLAALNLQRCRWNAPVEIVIVEPRSMVGRGLAYTAPSDRCTLNVPANTMGAFPDDPEGFLRWAREGNMNFSPDEFVSRRIYGDYLHSLLDSALEKDSRTRILTYQDTAVDVVFNEHLKRFEVELSRHGWLKADVCILALGNIPRAHISGIPVAGTFSAPYDPRSYDGIEHLRRVLVLGTGLTAVDCILECEGRGFRGGYTMLSRHARLPQPHDLPQADLVTQVDPLFSSVDTLLALSLTELVRRFREEATRLGSSQPILQVMRPHLQNLWAGMSLASKRRFLRHLRAIWEIHRHRIPGVHAALLDSLRKVGRLRLVAGRLVSAQQQNDSMELQYLQHGVSLQDHFDRAFICAGSEGDLSKVDQPLVRNLLARGMVRVGELKLGISVGESVIPREYKDRWRVLGPLQREELWEITAVREIRVEAARVATQICSLLNHEL